MAAEKRGITVVGVEASNFHRLTFAEVRLIPGEGLVRVTGKNGAGKTSLLRSIRAALGGASEIRPESVNDESEDGKGLVRLHLSNGFTVTRRFTEANPKGLLTVEGGDGGKYAQGKLAEWLGPLSFDPLAFFDLKPERQAAILLSLGGDLDLPAKLVELRKARAAKYEERTPWISQKRRAAQVVKPAGERPFLVDISAEMQRMGELQAQERERDDAFRASERARERAQIHANQVSSYDQEIVQLEAQLEKLRASRYDAEASRLEAERRAGELTAAAASSADPTAEMDAVRARIAAADQVHAAIRPWEAWETAQAELAAAVEQTDSLTAAMGELEVQEQQLVASAGIPVEGLGFSPEGAPVLNGRPLEVASGGERIRLSVAVALAANPELRVCLIDEANDLDLDALQALDELARSHGFQVWAARIGIEGKGEVHIVDGHTMEPEPVEVGS